MSVRYLIIEKGIIVEGFMKFIIGVYIHIHGILKSVGITHKFEKVMYQ
jgi:hypothetical protein